MSNQRKSLGNAGEAGIVKRAIAAGLRAFRQPGSGQFQGYPADVVIETPMDRILVESKVRSLEITTKGKSTWTIDFNWLRKVVKEAKAQGFSHGALFARPKGSQERYVLVEEAVYLDLLNRAN